MKTKYYIIAGVVLALIIFFGVRSCNTKKLEKQKVKQQINVAVVNQKDTSANIYYKDKISELDSLLKLEVVKNETTKKLVVYYKAQSKVHMNRADSLQQEVDSLEHINAPCAELLNVNKEINTELRKVIFTKDTIIESLGKEAESYSMQLYLCERKNAGSVVLITENAKTIKSLNEIIVQKDEVAAKTERKYNTGKIFRNLIIGFETTAIILQGLRK